MKYSHWLWLFGIISGMACAQLLMKASVSRAPDHGGLLETLLRPGVVAALALFGATFIGWTLLLRQVPLSTAYPVLGLSYAIVPFLSIWLFGETLDLGQIAGIALIVIGVALIAT